MVDFIRLDRTAVVLRWVMLIALIGLIVSWLAMNRAETVLVERGGGIITFQLAFTPERAQDILANWGNEGIAAARQSINTDFAFIPAYTLLFSSFTLLLARSQRDFLTGVGIFIALLPIIAGMLDIVENLIHLRILSGEILSLTGPVRTVGIIATIKFSLLLITSVYWLAAAIGLLRRRDLWAPEDASVQIDDDPPLW